MPSVPPHFSEFEHTPPAVASTSPDAQPPASPESLHPTELRARPLEAVPEPAAPVAPSIGPLLRKQLSSLESAFSAQAVPAAEQEPEDPPLIAEEAGESAPDVTPVVPADAPSDTESPPTSDAEEVSEPRAEEEIPTDRLSRAVLGAMRFVRRLGPQGPAKDPATPPTAGGGGGGTPPTTPEAPPSEGDEPDPTGRIPDYYHFHGSPGIVAQAKQAVAERLLFQPDLPVEGEVPLTSGETFDLARVSAEAMEMGWRVGIDLSDCLPHALHVMPDQESMESHVRSEGAPEGSPRVTSYEHGTVLRRLDDPADMAVNIAKGVAEGIASPHYMCQMEVTPEGYVGTARMLPGLEVLRHEMSLESGPTFIGAVYADLMADRLLAGTYGSPLPQLPGEAMVLDGVVRAAADHYGKTPDIVENTLFHAHITGHPYSLGVLHRALGVEVMNDVLSLPLPETLGDRMTPDEAIRTLEGLGLRDQAAAIAREHEAGEYRFFGWGMRR